MGTLRKAQDTSSVALQVPRDFALPPEGYFESLWLLTRLRCPVHDEMVLVQRRKGGIMFWCGCIRAGQSVLPMR